MAETKYCYRCHCKEHRDVLMDFNSRKGPYGAYECPECGYSIEKKSSGDNGEKYA